MRGGNLTGSSNLPPSVMKNIEHLLARNISDMRISIVPVPFDANNSGINSTVGAPSYVEKNGFSRALFTLGAVVTKEQVMREKDFVRTICSVQNSVAKILRRKEKCIVFGGTHTVALGSVSGALQVFGNELGVIWIDAHGDLNTHETSLTGNVHGMVLAALLGVGNRSLTRLVKKKLPAKNLLHVGLRDADMAEITLIKKRKLNVVTMGNIAENGLADCVKNIQRFAKHKKYVWVSVDIDVVDKNDAPASPMAAYGGLTYREITHLAKHIGDICNVVGMDFVEIAPKKDVQKKTAHLCAELAASLLGAIHSWYTEKYLKIHTRRAQSSRVL